MYFFSQENGQIKALCGQKYIVLPVNIASEINTLVLSQTSPEILLESYQAYFENLKEEPLLKEEYSHFCCLNKSFSANFFYLKDFVVRLISSSYLCSATSGKIHKHHRLNHIIINHSLQLMKFHHCAFPIVEAQHISELQSTQGYSSLIYEGLVLDQIKSHKNKVSYVEAGDMVDAIYFQKNSRINSNTATKLILFFKLFSPLILFPKAWPHLLNVFINNRRLIMPFLVGKLFPKSVNKNELSKLPAILSEKICIDPIGFPFGRTHLDNQEKQFDSEKRMNQMKLLWHMLNRSAQIYYLFKSGLDEYEILELLQALNEFYEKWCPRSLAGNIKTGQIDHELILEILAFHSEKVILNHGEIISCLEAISIIKYDKWEPKLALGDMQSSDAMALYCSYHNI